jgi:hypothetical protein
LTSEALAKEVAKEGCGLRRKTKLSKNITRTNSPLEGGQGDVRQGKSKKEKVKRR